MDGVASVGLTDQLLMAAARALTGRERRVFQGRVCSVLCDSQARRAEARFGWGRRNVRDGLVEFASTADDPVDKSKKPCGRLPIEQQRPQLAVDVRLIVEPHTHSDPELKTARQYTNLSAAEVREALRAKGYDESQLPCERTIRNLLNRMNYRLKRIQKGQPLKKTQDTDAIFENLKAAREKYADDPKTLEISVDTKSKVSLGEYSRGGKTRTDSNGNVPQAWDHDPPAKEKLVPFGSLILLTGALTLIFGHHETSDFWGDCLHAWWASVQDQFPQVRRLTIYLDNGPKNSGRRTQFLKRLIEFVDWSGLEVHLVYDPPYHSKYNPIERCWSSLQQKWNGVLLTCWNVVKSCAERMTWKGQHPAVMQMNGHDPIGVIVPRQEMKALSKRLVRSEKLGKYDILIRPLTPRGR